MKLVYITSYEEYCMQVIKEVHAFSFLCTPLEYDKLEMQMLELLDQLPDTGAEKDFYKVTDSNGKEYLSIKLSSPSASKKASRSALALCGISEDGRKDNICVACR